MRIRTPRPLPAGYPTELRTLGDHLRKRRLGLGLTLVAVARLLGVDPETLRTWEENRRRPRISRLPAIHDFLGYCLLPGIPPRTLGDLLRLLREAAGLSRATLARRLGLDEGTVRRLELGTTGRPTRRTISAAFYFLAEAIVPPKFSLPRPPTEG